MSTNACIAINNSHFNFDHEAIYCHWDGGQSLADELDEYFNTWEKARELIAGGDISPISKGYVESYHSRGDDWERVKPSEEMCLVPLLEKYSSAEFFHIFHDGEWTNLTREEANEIAIDFKSTY